MGGVPPALHSHSQQVEIIGVGSLTGSEIYFICTNFSAIRTSSEKLLALASLILQSPIPGLPILQSWTLEWKPPLVYQELVLGPLT